jgi:hypothetical protein
VSAATATRLGPPLSNRGANSATPSLHWDWYGATLPGRYDALSLLTGLSDALGVGPWEACPPQYGYSVGYRLSGVAAGSVQAFFRESDVHVQATSAAAIDVAEYLRRQYPSHRVSRADVALDFDAAGSFDRLYALVHDLARSPREGRRVTTSTAGDWLDREGGRTFYAGGTSSRCRVVVYEKGHEQRAKDPVCGASLDWTRVEWRLRPDTPEGKIWLATAMPLQAIGLTPFGALVASAVLETEVPAADAVRRYASQNPGYWMCSQYGTVVDALLTLDPVDAVATLAAWRASARGEVPPVETSGVGGEWNTPSVLAPR